MDANQLADALARAVEVAKPAQEYCFLWIDWWATCMTKAEWSGWMQAIGSLVALIIAIALPYWQTRQSHRKNHRLAKHCLLQQIALLHAIRTSSASAGPRKALYRSRESVETLSLTYQEVRVSELPVESLPSWLSARTTAGQLSSLIAELPKLGGSEDGLAVIIDGYLTTTTKNLDDFSRSGLDRDQRRQ
ncbi:hypothetical protein [Acidovorax sp. SDU_ACID1]|uniref:hypothetical protein n=1 Tax=Acidovorax sp. SDU_ACID1 TaxID=3136632 RepID=UPI003873AF69